MQKNILKMVTIFALMIVIFIQIEVFASTLTLNIKTDKEEIKVGNKFNVIVSWKEGMQAADFYLKYDSEKLDFIKADISDDYINSEEKGQVKTAWVSLDNMDKTEIRYTFEAIDCGTVQFETIINGGFATANLEIPNRYNEGKLILEILDNSIINIFKFVGIIIVSIIVLFILIRIIINIRIEKSRKKFR